MLVELLSTLKKDIYKSEDIYKFSNSIISSKDGEVRIEELSKGFSLIKYKDIELRRVLWKRLL